MSLPHLGTSPPPKKKMKQGNLLQFGILREGETVMMTSTRVMMTRRVRLPFGCCASKLCLRCTLMMHSGLMVGRGKGGKGGKGGAVRGWKLTPNNITEIKITKIF